MKNKGMRMLLLSVLFVLYIQVSFHGAAQVALATEFQEEQEQTGETAAEVSETFSCYTFDAQGRRLNGYWSEKDQVWYLFETSTQEIADTQLCYTGDIDSVSTDGNWDAENSVITNAFQESGDQIQLTGADGTVYTIIALQSDLPSVYITLNGTTLEEIHLDKEVKYSGNSLSIMDPDGVYDLAAEGTVEMKGRGNSTWSCYEKKSYQIKFDKKTSVMGMGSAKKWILLANAGDDSMMRTQLVYQMAEHLDMAFVPSYEYVDLWIDGEYRGTYILGEKVEPGSSRLNLSEDTGALFEHDEAFYQEEDYWLYSTILQRHFVLKEIVTEEEDTIQSAMSDFEAAVDQLASYLYSTPSREATLEELSSMIDVDSFIKYYLVNEYTLNRESFATSFYWYKDGPEDVIHLGPIWDFDTCMGNDGVSYTDSYGQNHVLFRYLLAIPEFYDRTQELWETYRGDITAMTANVDVLEVQLTDSAKMNYLRWDTLGEPNPKGGAGFYPTFSEAAAALKGWLSGRENAFSIAKSLVVTSAVSDDCYSMDICFQDDNSHGQVRFAVWSDDGGQDDLVWYSAKMGVDGAWRYTVDLSQHNSAGMYNIAAYADDGADALAYGRNYVEVAREPKYQTSAVLSEDCGTMAITMEDTTGLCTAVTFAVWSEEGGQDDLKWYSAQKDGDGSWVYTVDMKRHQSAGNYFIHVYSGQGEGRTLVDTAVVKVAFAVTGPVITAVVSEDDTTIQLILENAEGYSRIWAPVWSQNNGQDDIQWYELHQTASGIWTGEVVLTDHGDVGEYEIHIYSGVMAPEELIADTRVQVANVAVKHVRAVVSDNYETMAITLKEIGNWDQIWIPVWSEENGQDDIRWYQPEKQPDGTYTYTVDLRNHLSTGLYHIHVYGGTQRPETLLCYATVTVAALPERLPYINVSVENSILTVVLQDLGEWENIWVPIWSEENGQDDIQWYRPVRQADGSWEVVTDLNAHGSAGIYHLHVYGGGTAPQSLLAYTDIMVAEFEKKPVLETVLSNDTNLTVTLKNADGLIAVWIPVWSEENGQDDLQWYEALRQPDGTWQCVVDLAAHGSAPYHVHAYAGETSPTELLAYVDVYAA